MLISHVDVVAAVVKGVEVGCAQPLFIGHLVVKDVRRAGKDARRLKEEVEHLPVCTLAQRPAVDDG